jgi:hypothetical protein
MQKSKKLLFISLAALSMSNTVSAVGIARPEANKLDPVTGAVVKQFVERASHEFDLYVAHACDYYDSKGTNAAMNTTQVLAMLPSAKIDQFAFLNKTTDATTHTTTYTVDTTTKMADVFYTSYTDPVDPSKTIEATSGPVNNLKVSTNEIFLTTKPFFQLVSPYSHHGKARDITTSAAWWKGGTLNGQFYTSLKFRGTTARLRGCVSKVDVIVPVWQMCGATDYTSYSVHPGKKGANDFAPSFSIVRNEIFNPYPTICKTDLTKRRELTISPTPAFINQYLTATALPGSRTVHSFAH